MKLADEAEGDRPAEDGAGRVSRSHGFPAVAPRNASANPFLNFPLVEGDGASGIAQLNPAWELSTRQPPINFRAAQSRQFHDGRQSK